MRCVEIGLRPSLFHVLDRRLIGEPFVQQQLLEGLQPVVVIGRFEVWCIRSCDCARALQNAPPIRAMNNARPAPAYAFRAKICAMPWLCERRVWIGQIVSKASDAFKIALPEVDGHDITSACIRPPQLTRSKLDSIKMLRAFALKWACVSGNICPP